jgi:hypothetical protein
VIVRLMGEGQYRIDDALAARLNALDDEAAVALERNDEEALGNVLERMAQAVKDGGDRLPDEDLSPSDAIIPPTDLSLEEARALFSDEGLIPDLPAPTG